MQFKVTIILYMLALIGSSAYGQVEIKTAPKPKPAAKPVATAEATADVNVIWEGSGTVIINIDGKEYPIPSNGNITTSIKSGKALELYIQRPGKKIYASDYLLIDPTGGDLRVNISGEHAVFKYETPVQKELREQEEAEATRKAAEAKAVAERKAEEAKAEEKRKAEVARLEEKIRLEEEARLAEEARRLIITIDGKSIEVANEDLPDRMSWKQAIEACQALGNGWRLPNRNELWEIHHQLYKRNKGSFKSVHYWSITEDMKIGAFTVYFQTGTAVGFLKRNYFNVRAVRTI
jgi:hypothetical protein